MLSLLKMIGSPGSISFLLLCLIGGVLVLWLWPNRRRFGRAWLALVAVAYLFMALPAVATAIAGRLSATATPPAAVGHLDTLAVLDGDNRRGRVRVAQQILSVDAPKEVWVLGGPWIVEALAAAGVPKERLFHDPRTPTTRDQLARVQRLIAERPTGRVGVIVSRLQAPRVARLAAAQLMPLVLIVSPVDDEPPTSGVRAFIPRYIALRVSRDALYEHAALAYYRWRQWIR